MDRSSQSMEEAYNSNTNNSTDNMLKYIGIAGGVSLLIFLVGLTVVVGFADPFAVNDTQPTSEVVEYSELYEDTRESVASVYISNESGSQTQGSGFVYNGKYILTNHHVIDGQDKVYIQYEEGQWSNATVVGSDEYTDIAVLDPEEKPSYADSLSIETELPERGSPTAVIGTPQGLRGTITTGVVSGTGRTMQTGTGFVIPDMIQTDSPLNGGNSGGPLINMDGDVIGIVNAKQGENIGFAISARMVEEVSSEIITSGDYTHSYLGVSTVELSPLIAEANSVNTTNGVLVVSTAQGTNSPDAFNIAENSTNISGRSVPVDGDIIVAVDGQQVRDNEELGSYLIRKTSPGETVDITVLRDGTKEVVSVRLVNRP